MPALRNAPAALSTADASIPTALSARAPYHLPATIASDVALVGELLQFPRLRDARLNDIRVSGGTWANACDARGCKGKVTPAVLGERYKIPVHNSTPGQAQSTMAVAEFQGQYFNTGDIAAFGSSCHINASVTHVIGGNKPDVPGIEAEVPQGAPPNS